MVETERELTEPGITYVAGIDEVGRGPLAGPVYAAAVVLPADFELFEVNDSKKLSKKKREELAAQIRECATAIGIGKADNQEIDEINILNATKRAMKRAIDDANASMPEGTKIEQVIVDAVSLTGLDIPVKSVIKGDEKCVSVAAASIIAKVERDAYMAEMDKLYPGYGFLTNSGYGTEAHYAGIEENGITPIHRKTFLKSFDPQEGSGSPWHKPQEKAIGTGGSKKRKFYAVKEGRETGIFDTWDECRKSVEGFPGAQYKSFAAVEDAESYLGIAAAEPGGDGKADAYVDGSYNAAKGAYSGAAVIIFEGKEIELSKAFFGGDSASLRNVAGEIAAAEMAVQYCVDNGIKAVRIHHDYNGIAKWGDDEWKANLPQTKRYKEFVREARRNVDISFIKVKAHSGNKYNERADELATLAISSEL